MGWHIDEGSTDNTDLYIDTSSGIVVITDTGDGITVNVYSRYTATTDFDAGPLGSVHVRARDLQECSGPHGSESEWQGYNE